MNQPAVQDIDRPDVNGVEPKMQAIRNQTREQLKQRVILFCPVMNITTDDNLCSTVNISGSFDPREDWPNGIFQNSRYFRFSIHPAKRMRYYDPSFENGRVTVVMDECYSGGYRYQCLPFRKYTGSVQRCIDRIVRWIETTEKVNQSTNED